MARQVKVGGSWHNTEKHFCRVGGKWRQVAARYVKANGVWRQVFAEQFPIGLIENNADNFEGTYSLRFTGKGQLVCEVSGYCRDTSRGVSLGFRLMNIPATRKVEYDFSAQASNVNAYFQVWNNTELSTNTNGGSGGGSLFYAQDHVDFLWAIAANASSGPVNATFTINGLTVEGVTV